MKVKVLEQRHPSYDGDRLEQYQALYEGGSRWEALVPTWLPRHPEELDENYACRLNRVLYHNHAGPIVDLIAGMLFSQPPTVQDFEHAWYGEFAKNVDREGHSLDQWFKAILGYALVGRWALAWINLPATDPDNPPESRAEQEARGELDAYLDDLEACQVIDWERDPAGKLRWVMVRGEVTERASVESKRTRKVRWTYIDAALIRRWEWTPPEGVPNGAPKDDSEAVELPPVPHGMKELPIVELGLPPGLHAMGKLHHPAIAHTRARNGLSWALDRGAHPLLVIREKFDNGKPVLGPGHYLRVDEDGDAFYVEPTGASFALLAEDVVALREELYRVVHQMAVGANTTAISVRASGESKQADWQALEIVLSALAKIVRPAIAETLRLVAKARGETTPKAPTVGGLEGWQQEDLETWLAAAAGALDAHQLSPTFRKEVAKRQARRVLTDADAETMDAIDGEIDSASTADHSPYLPPPPVPPTGDQGGTT